MRIAVDFDGTIVRHAFPKIGLPVPGAVDWLKEWKRCGATLILWTVRSGDPLREAVAFCEVAGVFFDFVNRVPADMSWTASPKVHANIFVDDAAFGCPLITVPGARPYVDWSVVGPKVTETLLLND